MTGWLVNDRLTAIPGTRTLWHHLLDAIPGLLDKTYGQYAGLAQIVNREAAIEKPDYIIRNAAYFQRLEVDCPVVSFVQDILHGFQRDILVDACAASRLVVFNSEYTRAAYPELHAAEYRTIPVGTDESVFYQRDVPRIPTAVLWVGSGHPVKGYDLAFRLASESARPWVFVMKDDAPVPDRCEVHRRISQDALAELASACTVGVCTSREETQHLAGIEMGMCGLPLVTTDVGVYHGRSGGKWGLISGGDWHEEIVVASTMSRDAAAAYWRSEGFGLDACMASWCSVVEQLEVAHVHG